MTIRLGVIGAGSWAVSSHLPNFARHDDVKMVGVSRHGAEELERVRSAYAFDVASEDYRDILQHHLDVVLVSSPSGLHYEHALAAMQAGAHVLIEKPVTIDPARAWHLVEVARALDRHVTVAFGWNHRPMVRRARTLMTEHGIGRVESVAVTMASQTRELLSGTGDYPDADPQTVPEGRTWTDSNLSGGGYGQAQLSHALGLSLWLLGHRVDGIFARTAHGLGSSVELHDAAVLSYDDGAIGTLSGSSNHLGAGGNKHQLVVQAIGSRGQLRVDVEREDLWLYRDDGVEVHDVLRDGDGAYDCIGPVDTILGLVRGSAIDNPSPLELGARTVEALDLLYRSARSGMFESREQTR